MALSFHRELERDGAPNAVSAASGATTAAAAEGVGAELNIELGGALTDLQRLRPEGDGAGIVEQVEVDVQVTSGEQGVGSDLHVAHGGGPIAWSTANEIIGVETVEGKGSNSGGAQGQGWEVVPAYAVSGNSIARCVSLFKSEGANVNTGGRGTISGVSGGGSAGRAELEPPAPTLQAEASVGILNVAAAAGLSVADGEEQCG